VWLGAVQRCKGAASLARSTADCFTRLCNDAQPLVILSEALA